MELTAAISGIQSAKISNEIDFAVARKVLDAQKQSGAGVLQMLEAATISPGDELVAAATGLGGTIDMYG